MFDMPWRVSPTIASALHLNLESLGCVKIFPDGIAPATV
jgi:hypothetical protein